MISIFLRGIILLVGIFFEIAWLKMKIASERKFLQIDLTFCLIITLKFQQFKFVFSKF
jgi:hypothetical protein